MISLKDARWSNMTGGYKTPFDPRPLLNRLESDSDTADAWHDLWDELHHQGDVGEASFAAVPFIVRNYRKRGVLDWNTFAIVAIIELAHKERNNPDVPQWIGVDYFQAIRELARVGAAEVLQAENTEDVRAMLSVIAIEKGLRSHGELLLKDAEHELREVVSKH